MIGKVPLDQLAKDRNLMIEWKAFELRPEGFEIPPKPPEYVARAKAGVEMLGKKYGLEMKFNDKSKHSRMALEGAKFAEAHGRGNDYHNAVFSAQFQQEKNINDFQVLAEIAAQIGLNREEFREAVVSRHYKQAVQEEVDEAQRLDIQSVPCYIINGRKAFGVQSYEDLVRLLEGNEPTLRL